MTRAVSPLVGTAIHDGHNLHGDIAKLMALNAEERLREEDPFTAAFIQDLGNRVVVHRSRFEVDMNRPREGAVYLRPEQAWGLDIWHRTPSEERVEAMRRQHDGYYQMLRALLEDVQRAHGRFVLLDMHSYNHRRAGPEAPPTAQIDAPDINIGTFSMERAYWAPVVDAFMECLRRQPFPGRRLDVRENVAFAGKGEQTRFVHANFPRTGCAIAVEFKKIFMDEWTGQPDLEAIKALRAAIRASLPVLEKALAAMPGAAR
ncbi:MULTISPECIES: N-formylglutamate amidohydrolase [unclassified Rhizobium]|uniref:N-formylglutamate amidohydrolase n=1 Tax=unclassified Rhizobium TaxID=2613769 RepID=UPI000B15CCB6|nr:MULTISPECIES: N-formylglutamate amidohydrolase [unclassified Rhizobium]